MAMTTNTSSGWTPIYDEIAQKHGIVTAAVFGIIWRFCQMRERVCRASIANLAARLGINRLTVMRHIELLTSEGLIKDLSPTLRNRPHVYVVTRQAAQLISGGVTRAEPSLEDDCDEGQEIDECLEAGTPISDTDVEIIKPDPVSTSNPTICPAVSESDGAVSRKDSDGIKAEQPAVSTSDMNKTLLRESFLEDKKRQETAKEIWRAISDQLEPDMSKGPFSHWVYPTRALSWDGTTLSLGVRDEDTLAWFNRFITAAIQAWLWRLSGAAAGLSIIVLPDSLDNNQPL
jgi:DNA-binding transcriptional regulator YhcF (GntR family)